MKHLKKELGKDWLILIKAHPHLDERAVRENGHPISNCRIPTERLLSVTDLLVTDYSSTLFDYILFEKPFVLFSPDLEEYQRERGFYVEYKSLTSYLAVREEELIPAIRHAYADWKSGKSRRELKECREFHDQSCDGKATSRILDYLEMRDLMC